MRMAEGGILAGLAGLMWEFFDGDDDDDGSAMLGNGKWLDGGCEKEGLCCS